MSPSERQGLMREDVTLIPIDRDGAPRDFAGPISELLGGVLGATAELYASVGFEEPWIGYVAAMAGQPVGTCAFKSPPCEGRVEIAYFTFPEFEGRGIATAMAAKLVAMARQTGSDVVVAAQTLPERNASHAVLEKLGFRHVDTVEHPEDGTVWEWRLEHAAGE